MAENRQIKGVLGSIVRKPEGMREEGNINLAERQRRRNPDGTFSTLRSMSVGYPQGEVLMPTVAPNGWYMSPDQAMNQYQNTGQHLGIFGSPDQANIYAQMLSRFMGR
jgi:hypothetical protein